MRRPSSEYLSVRIMFKTVKGGFNYRNERGKAQVRLWICKTHPWYFTVYALRSMGFRRDGQRRISWRRR